jgi:hypothetical protein
MNRTIATTLIIANQYSKLPKLPTLRALTYSRADRKSENPKPFRSVREPPLAVDRDGRRFAADGDALRRPIRVAHREARPRFT